MKVVATAVDTVYREHASTLIAALVQVVRDIDLAEDLLHEAIGAAMKSWETGIPDNPAGWLLVSARRKAIDRFRHEKMSREKQAMILQLEELIRTDDDPDLIGGFRDERLRLIFTCCHPSLSLEARVALTLKTICGLQVPEISRAFFTQETTMSQRLVRAKKKIRLAGIPYKIPDAEELPSRLGAVLGVVYLVFNEGYHSTTGEIVNTDLCSEAIRLARAIVTLTDDNEAAGLLALLLFHDARRETRVDADGSLLTLEEQNRERWDAESIEEGDAILSGVLGRGDVGPYQLQAAIAGIHATSPRAIDTNWTEIVVLYDHLMAIMPTDIVRLNRAAAVAMAFGVDEGLLIIDALVADGNLENYPLLYAAQADLLRRKGDPTAAVSAYRLAIERTQNSSEIDYYNNRIAELSN